MSKKKERKGHRCDLFEEMPELSRAKESARVTAAETHAAQPQRKKGGFGRIPELDGWRALLVFWVSWYHIWQQSWLTPYIGGTSLDYLVRAGYMPVDGTVLLSGFLLFLPYVKSMADGSPWPSARAFYQRRVRRIVPSYVAFTLLMLFAVAIPDHAYRSTGAMAADLAAHFTFTFTFFRQTYLGTPLGAASWTLCVETQMYLIFPLIARLARKRPAGVMLGMCAISAYFRMWAMWRFTDYQMVVNQLVSFLDTYAIGMACAVVYVRIREVWDELKPKWVFELCFTAMLATCCFLITVLLQEQARCNGQGGIQAGQMLRRLPWSLLLAGCMVSLPFTVKPLRVLFGNPVTKFLSMISMNYYLVHQPVAVYLKRIGVPFSPYELPNQVGDKAWQYAYTWLSFGLSLALAVLLTFVVERPGSWALGRLFRRKTTTREA